MVFSNSLYFLSLAFFNRCFCFFTSFTVLYVFYGSLRLLRFVTSSTVLNVFYGSSSALKIDCDFEV